MPETAHELEEVAIQLEALAKRVRSVGVENGVTKDSLSPGTRLVRARNRANMTQEGLARISGVAANTIINFENGRTRPRPRTLMALAEAVGIPWEALQEDDDEAE
jgi:DNA-binding XRE family transcriptional regulator